MNEIDRNKNISRTRRGRALNKTHYSSSDDEYSLEDEEYDLEDEEEDVRETVVSADKDKKTKKTEAGDKINGMDEDEDEGEDEDGDEDEEDSEKEKKRHSPFLLMLEMMINPVNGWKRFRRAGFTTEKVAAGCFFPLVGIAACSCFIECIYDSSVTLSAAMVDAVKIFAAFFFGNFVVLMAFRLFMPAKYKDVPDKPFGKQYVMLMLSTLALFWTLYECLPMIGPVLFFLPLWTIYLAMRGVRFFRFPEEKKSLLTTLICISLIVAPFGVYYIFDLFL